MFILFDEWRRSLAILSPKYFKPFFGAFFKNYLKATLNFFKYFGWLVFLDIIGFIFWGDRSIKLMQSIINCQPPFTLSKILGYFAFTILGSFILTGYLLCIRRGASSYNWKDLAYDYLRYYQLSLIIFFISLVILNFILALGITIIPNIHWSLIIIWRVLNFLMIFYWLDSEYRLKDVFVSLEKALNLFLYTVPFWVVLLVVWCTFNGILSFILNGTVVLERILAAFDTTAVLNLKEYSWTPIFIIKILVVKLLKLLGGYFFVCFIFAFYALKKNVRYTDSFIE
jgi:hypothetical protein